MTKASDDRLIVALDVPNVVQGLDLGKLSENLILSLELHGSVADAEHEVDHRVVRFVQEG